MKQEQKQQSPQQQKVVRASYAIYLEFPALKDDLIYRLKLKSIKSPFLGVQSPDHFPHHFLI